MYLQLKKIHQSLNLSLGALIFCFFYLFQAVSSPYYFNQVAYLIMPNEKHLFNNKI